MLPIILMQETLAKLTPQKKNQTALFSLLLFFLTITILGLPFTNWGFKTDDFGNIYHCKINSLKDMVNFFTEGNMERFNHASNSTSDSQAFFAGLYRPVSFIYYYAQYLLFGTNPYGYFLTTVIFHALNSVLLFNIFIPIAGTLGAFLAAAFFAFHPSLWNWLGWISAQTYFIELFVLLLLILALKHYLDSKKIIFYILSCTLFALNLFLKEATIILPLWIIPAVYLYLDKNPGSLWKSLRVSLGYWLVVVGYVAARLSMFPLTSNTGSLTFEPTLASFLARMQSRVLDFVTYAVDMIGFTTLPANNRIFKGSLLLAFFALLAWLFIHNQQKKWMIFFLYSTALFSWPALLMHYQPRYIYMALPFFLLMILVGFKFYQSSYQPKIYKAVSYALCLIIATHAYFLFDKLALRESVLHQVTQSFQTLANNQTLHNRPLCFVGIPSHWFSMGTAQAMWLLTNNNSYPVYQCDAKMYLAGNDNYLKVPALDKNYLEIIKNEDGFLLQSLHKDKLWFADETGKRRAQVSLSIPKEAREHNTIFITWDYYKAEFKILS